MPRHSAVWIVKQFTFKLVIIKQKLFTIMKEMLRDNLRDDLMLRDDLLKLFATSFNRKPMNFWADTSFTYFPKWRNKIKVNLLVLQHSLLHRCFSINLQNMSKHLKYRTRISHKSFKNELSKISLRQPLKYLQCH